jgi:hypothetical protein
MDRREMKKHILFQALENYYQIIDTRFSENHYFDLSAYILDKEETDITPAEIKRFRDLLQEMVENAMDKLG